MTGSMTCPSAPGQPGSALFGVVPRKDKSPITPNVPVTKDLLAILGQSGALLENQLRF